MKLLAIRNIGYVVKNRDEIPQLYEWIHASDGLTFLILQQAGVVCVQYDTIVFLG